MSAAVYYKKKCLIECSSTFLLDLSEKMIKLAKGEGYADDENLIVFISDLNYSWVFGLDDELSDEEVKSYAKYAIQAIDQMFSEGYFILSPAGIQSRIEKNISLDLPLRDHLPALEYKENLKELLKELDNS